MFKRNIASFVLVFLFMLGAVAFNDIARAQGCANPQTPEEIFTCSVEGGATQGKYKPGLEPFIGRPHGGSSVEPGADILTTAIFNIIDFAKYVLGTVAIVYITLGGIRLITSGKDIEEVSTKQKKNLLYILIGLFLAIISDVLVTQVFFGDYGECLASETNAQACAEQGALQIRGIYNFIEVFIATIAVLVLVLTGFTMVVSAGDEDLIGKQKKRIGFALAGLVLIAVSEFVVKDIIFPESGALGVSPEKGIRLISMITNFVSAFVGTLSIAFLIYGGYLAVTSIGNPDKLGTAKKIIIGAIIGILIAFAAFGIVRTFLSIDTLGEPSEPASFLNVFRSLSG